MPKLPLLAQLRSALPYAAKLLPLLAGVAPAVAAPPDLTPLNHRFGEIQTESRSLRSEVVSHGEQLAGVKAQLDRLLASSEQAAEAQQALAAALQSMAGLLKGLLFATLFLLLVLTALSAMVLVRVSHG